MSKSYEAGLATRRAANAVATTVVHSTAGGVKVIADFFRGLKGDTSMAKPAVRGAKARA